MTKAPAANNDRYWLFLNSGLPTQRYVIIDWDMRVGEPNIELGVGPFFGIQAYDGPAAQVPKTFGALGVDATTGQVLSQTSDGGGTMNPTGSLANFNQWYHYRLILDITLQKMYGIFNGALVINNKGYADGTGLNSFTDADIATFALDTDFSSQTKTASAYFDNFRIRDGLLGDYDIDGDVDDADYTRWRSTLGTTVSPAGNLADGNRNGIVDAADYVVWRDNRNTTIFTIPGAGSAVVPEPASFLMLVLGIPFALILGASRRRPALRNAA